MQASSCGGGACARGVPEQAGVRGATQQQRSSGVSGRRPEPSPPSAAWPWAPWPWPWAPWRRPAGPRAWARCADQLRAGAIKPTQKTPMSSVVLCKFSCASAGGVGGAAQRRRPQRGGSGRGRRGRRRTSCASNLQCCEPSSCTSLHQRSPTINLPDTFLTVQKSKASRSTHTTNTFTKLLENQSPNM